MYKTIAIGRIFFGLGVAGIGIMHFMYPGFRPVIIPLAPEETIGFQWAAYLLGAVIALAGIAVVTNYYVKSACQIIGYLFLALFLIGHLPNRVQHNPEILGMWTDAVKLLALAGGAFVCALSQSGVFTKRDTLLFNAGTYLFAIMLVLFGIDHFLYVDFVKSLVPEWIGGQMFWTYTAGIALIAAGLSILLRIMTPIGMKLLAGTLFIWLLVLHIPRTVALPFDKMDNEMISCMECLAFCGIALLISYRTAKPAIGSTPA